LGKVVWTRRYWAHGSRKKPIYYLAKYLSRQYKRDRWSFGDFVFYACVVLGAKIYTFSRGITFPRKRRLVEWKVFACSYEQLVRIIEMNVGLSCWSFSLPLEYYAREVKGQGRVVLWSLMTL